MVTAERAVSSGMPPSGTSVAEPSGRDETTPAERAACLAFALAAVLLSLLQRPGSTTYDTRAELTVRPGDFLASAFGLWHPETNLGEVQNQAYGYLFPQGAWAVAVDLVGMPGWVGQRLWSALVLVIAFEGARRFARHVGLDAGGRLLAGLAFACAPRVLGTVGVLSAETLPGAWAPWVAIPVLLAMRGVLGPVRAALLSGAAVVAMGGVNAVENIGAMPVAIILVIWGAARGLLSRRFLVVWSGVLAAASLWWVLPLAVLAGTAPPFYAYVESARDTTAPIGWSEALQGSTHWVSTLVTGGQPWWPAAYALATDPVLIVVGCTVTAIGLVGLLLLPHDLRAPLSWSALVGLVALTIAHGGVAGAPAAGPMVSLLDGPLQIFRNVHKIDPTLRLPLAVGFGWACTVGAAGLARRRPRLTDRRPLLLALPALLVLMLTQPFVTNQVRSPGWDAIPVAWVQTRDLLAEREGTTAALVVPGSGFAQQVWGWTLDEPLTVLGGVRTVTRSQVPLVPGQTIRFLDALDSAVAGGRAGRQLPDQLARVGIGHVVVRYDLDRAATGSPDPVVARTSLARAGLRRVAGFGPDPEAPTVEVYEVPGAADVPRVRVTAATEVATVAGEPESALSLVDLGLVRPEAATVLAGDAGAPSRVDVVTDQAQRRERAFGRVEESVSAVMGADDPYRVERATHDYPGAERGEPVLARHRGLDALLASSAQAYADTFGPVVPADGPHAALDGRLDTRWVSSPVGRGDRQWIRLDLAQAQALEAVTVWPVVQDDAFLTPRALEVRTDGEVRRVRVRADGAPVRVSLSGAEVDRVEVAVVAVRARDPRGRVGLREIRFDGPEGTLDLGARSLEVPAPIAAGAQWLLTGDAGRRACLPRSERGGPDCAVSRIRRPEEADGPTRSLRVDQTGSWRLSGTVEGRATPSAARLLDPLDASQEVRATSVYADDPQLAARFAYDGDPRTAWSSAAADRVPTLVVTWDRPRVVRGLRVTPTTGPLADLAPVSALVRTAEGAQRVRLGPDELTRMVPVRTDRLEIAFVPGTGRDRVAVGDVVLDGVDLTRPFDPATPTGAVCGLGPEVRVGSQVVATRVEGRMGDLVDGAPLRWRSCVPGADAAPGVLRLDAGRPEVRLPPSGEFAITALAADPARPSDPDPTTRGDRGARVTEWSAHRRVVEVAGGARALLWIPESANAGWRASLAGEDLVPVRVDGWMQGWWLPAGSGGTIELRFAPQAAYAVLLPAGLLVSGGVLVAGGVVAAGAVASRRRGPRPVPGRRRTSRTGVGPWPRRARGLASGRSRAAVAAVVLALVVVAGPVVALAAAAAAALAHRVRRPSVGVLAALAGSCVAAGLLDVAGAAVLGDLAGAVAVGLWLGSLSGPVVEEVTA